MGSDRSKVRNSQNCWRVVIYGFRISSFSGIGGRRDILREVDPVRVA
jgi:hypothetical protein